MTVVAYGDKPGHCVGGFGKDFPVIQIVRNEAKPAVRLRADAHLAREHALPPPIIHGQVAQSRPNAGIQINAGLRTVAKLDAVNLNAAIGLQVVAEIVARLEVSRHRRLMVRSGNAADVKLGHEGRAEREVPRRFVFRFLLFRLLLLLFGLALLLFRLVRLRHLHARRVHVRRLRVSQIIVLAQVKRELGDEGCAAPVGTRASRIDRGADHTARGVVVSKGIAIALVQIRVVVAQVEGEWLPNECKAGVPGGVALKRNAAREAGYGVEVIARSQEPMTDVGRYEPADAIGKDSWQNVFCRTRHKRPIGARVEDRGRPVGATAQRELIAHRVEGLAVNFPEAQIALDDVTVQQAAQTARGEIVEALSARIPVVPTAKIEGEPAEGRPDAAVKVDLGGGAGPERDGLPRQDPTTM